MQPEQKICKRYDLEKTDRFKQHGKHDAKCRQNRQKRAREENPLKNILDMVARAQDRCKTLYGQQTANHRHQHNH